MSQHTIAYLEENQAYGFTNHRPNAWWFKAGMTNHYPESIPESVVEAILDKAYAIERPVFITNEKGEPFKLDDRKAIYIPHYKNAAYIAKLDFQIHQAKETLLKMLQGMINGVGYASVGVLKHGAMPYVQLEYPNSDEANCANKAFKFRAGLLAATALDGTLKSTIKDTLTGVCCDNTLSAALWGGGDQLKVKHTSNSLARLSEGGDAFTAVKGLAERMGYAIEAASRRVVTEAQFQAFLEKLVPMPKPIQGEGILARIDPAQRSVTLATNKRNVIADLYHKDERAAPWAGSVLGVMQAVNTYNVHEATIRGAEHRADRIAENLISGKVDMLDALAMETLNRVLVAA